MPPPLTTTLLAALLGGALSSAAAAQVVMPSQPLDFGQIIAGVTEVVPPTDVTRRGDITIQGTSTGDASLTLVLPTELQSPDGTMIPLQFLAGDVLFQQPQGGRIDVNLTGPTTVRLHNRRPGHLYLGGRAIPSVGQRAGSYSATIVVVVAPPGV